MEAKLVATLAFACVFLYLFHSGYGTRGNGPAPTAGTNLVLEKVLEQKLTVPVPEVVATMVHITLPPGDMGLLPHFHSGPTVGYVLEGEMLFQVNEEQPRIVRAGEAFFERDRDIHVWSANPSNKTACTFVATVYGRPGEPVTTIRDNYPRQSFAEALAAAQRVGKEELKR